MDTRLLWVSANEKTERCIPISSGFFDNSPRQDFAHKATSLGAQKLSDKLP